MLYQIWNDCDGGVITTELVLVASVLTATLLTGLGSFRTHLEQEFQQLGQNLHQAATTAEPPTSAPIANVPADEFAGTIFAGDLESFLVD